MYSLSDKVREFEENTIDEGKHHNTKVRDLSEKTGSKKIRLTVQECKKMIESMLDNDSDSPNPKTINDKKSLEECKTLAEQMIPRLKAVKESKAPLKNMFEGKSSVDLNSGEGTIEIINDYDGAITPDSKLGDKWYYFSVAETNIKKLSKGDKVFFKVVKMGKHNKAIITEKR